MLRFNGWQINTEKKMLVKVNQGLYIKSDNVIAVELIKENGNYIVSFADAIANSKSLDNPLFSIAVTSAAAAFLLDLMDAQSAVQLPGDPGYVDSATPSVQPLASRIAQLLRDTLTQGASSEEIATKTSTPTSLVAAALAALLQERVIVVTDKAEDRGILYYHASHRPNKPTPAPEADLITTSDNNAYCQMLRTGAYSCKECMHVSCGECVTQEHCCQCRYPFFILNQSRANSALEDIAITPSPDPLTESASQEQRPVGEDSESLRVPTIDG